MSVYLILLTGREYLFCWHLIVHIMGKRTFKETRPHIGTGHADADQLGTDFFRFRWMSDPILSVPNETESAMGLKSLSRQLTKVIKNIWQLK